LYLNVLKPDGKLILVGMPPEAMEFAPAGIVLARKTIGGSMIGGIKVSLCAHGYFSYRGCSEQEKFGTGSFR
jgi:D-arabinose 1-dehydrogenase-like Zn-dependent alcohol dehydrogenase